jgi:hypothetical protein
MTVPIIFSAGQRFTVIRGNPVSRDRMETDVSSKMP